MTRVVRLDAGTAAFLPPELVRSLRSGGMAVYPTDTLYGLGVDPRSPAALARLAAAKGRNGGKAIPLLLDEPARAAEFAAFLPPDAQRLIARFWPGALTIVVPAAPDVLPPVTGGTGTVGLRVPGHPVPRELARRLGGAITGTSANRSGNPGIWRSAEEIVAEFSGEVDWILWDGPPPAANAPPGGPPPASTVVRAGDGGVVLLREGAVPFREIETFRRGG